MKLKNGSIIFLLILFIVLTFIIGVRQGQRVEKTNKIINYLISIPPSPTTQPTQIPLEFKSYKHDGCKIQFLHPSFLQKTSTSSTSAKFAGNFQSLEFDCSKNSAGKFLDTQSLATTEVKLKGKVTKTKIRPDIRLVVDAVPTLLFNMPYPKTGKNIFVEISKSIFPLFEKTLEFLP